MHWIMKGTEMKSYLLASRLLKEPTARVRELTDGRGADVILEIDVQGAAQVRAQVPDAVGVFILPPSTGALEQRMRKRGQDSEDVIARRLAAAREEMSHHAEFDYIVVNEDFDLAVDELCAIFRASRLRRERQVERHTDLIRGLLAG